MVTNSFKVQNNLACSHRNIHNEVFFLFTEKNFVICLLSLLQLKLLWSKGTQCPSYLRCHTNKGMSSRNPGQKCECYSVSSKIRVLNLQIVFQIFLYEIVGYLWTCLRGKKCSCSIESGLGY